MVVPATSSRDDEAGLTATSRRAIIGGFVQSIAMSMYPMAMLITILYAAANLGARAVLRAVLAALPAGEPIDGL